MKKLLSLLALVACVTGADTVTNVLELTWVQPPGYNFQLYTATNMAGQWTPMTLATSSPPVSVTCTQSVAYFYIVTTPTNAAQNMVGNGDPHALVSAGSTYLDTNCDCFWVNRDGSTNGWIQLL